MSTQPAQETTGARIARLRKAIIVKRKGLPKPMHQEELSHRCHCDKGTISRIERDEWLPCGEMLIVMSALFNVSTDYLLCLTDNPALPDKR